MPAKSATFLDANAGLPLHPSARRALLEALERNEDGFPFNPASPHSLGQNAKRVLERARRQILHSLVSEEARRSNRVESSGSFLFTGSGTEANQWVIRAILDRPQGSPSGLHWVTTAAEHDSVLQMIDWARERGIRVTVLPLDSRGQPSFEDYRRALESDLPPTLISILLANNETGVILDRPSPIEESSSLAERVSSWVSAAKACGALVHFDGAQVWGKLPLELDRLGGDFVTFSGHKIGGMAGSGGVWLSPGQSQGSKAAPGRLILGKAEQGKRGGTASVLAALLLGEAAAATSETLLEKQNTISQIRNAFENGLLARFGDRVLLNGSGSPRLAGTSNITFVELDGEGLVAALDLEGFAVSSGSACSSGTLEPSHVLLAMGRTREEARASLRVSFSSESLLSHESSHALVTRFVDTLEKVVHRMTRAPNLRTSSGVPTHSEASS